jgi:hypothetical protein
LLRPLAVIRHVLLPLCAVPFAIACSSGSTSGLGDGDGGPPPSSDDGGVGLARDGQTSPPSDDAALANSEDAGDAAEAGPDLATDPNNCGFSGHVCEATCTGGYCDPVAMRVLDASAYFLALDGDSLYYTNGLDGKTLYEGSLSSSTGDVAIATLPAAPQDSNIDSFLTSKSYVFFETSTGGVTVNKATHKVATFTFATNGAAFGGIVGNDAGVYWFDDSGYLWTVPMTGGTPHASYSWTMTALAADESGEYFYGGPQGGDTTGVWMLSGSTSKQLADNVAQTWSLQIGTKNVYGAAPSGTSSACTQASTLWRVPKTGSSGGAGGVTTVYKSASDIAQFIGDDTSLVWTPCGATSVVSVASTGGKTHVLVPTNANDPCIDGAYLYFWQEVGETTSSQLFRVTL